MHAFIYSSEIIAITSEHFVVIPYDSVANGHVSNRRTLFCWLTENRVLCCVCIRGGNKAVVPKTKSVCST